MLKPRISFKIKPKEPMKKKGPGDFKYFSEESIRALLDPNASAVDTVNFMEKEVQQKVSKLEGREYEEAVREAKEVSQLIRETLRQTKAYDRQNKMHRLYNEIKFAESREQMMTILTTCNNAAFFVIREAIDRVRKLPEYNARFSKLRKIFNMAEEELSNYDRRLRCSDKGWFDYSRYTDAEKKRYADDVSKEDYIDYWQRIGGKAYLKALPEINVLRNKFKLSIEAHDIPNAETCAYVLAGSSMLILCDAVFNTTLKRFSRNYNISHNEAIAHYGDFSMNRMMLAWGRCVKSMGPVTRLDENESHNIELTLQQLIEHWNEYSFFVTSLMEEAEDSPEIFRTKGEQKKYLRELSDQMK